MLISLTELEQEIRHDPLGLGYGPLLASDSDASIAALMSAHAQPTGTVWRSTVPAQEIVSCLVLSEVETLATARLAVLGAVLSAGSVDATDENARALLLDMFPTETCPRTNRNLSTAMSKRLPSRAESLWGDGAIVTHLDVARALGRG